MPKGVVFWVTRSLQISGNTDNISETVHDTDIYYNGILIGNHMWRIEWHQYQPGIEWVQALADISRSALCYHSNEARAPIANSLNSAQLQGTPIPFPKLHPGPYSSVGMRWGTERQTDTQTDTQTAVTTILSPRLRLTRNVMNLSGHEGHFSCLNCHTSRNLACINYDVYIRIGKHI